jgi:hypothetical protein
LLYRLFNLNISTDLDIKSFFNIEIPIDKTIDVQIKKQSIAFKELKPEIDSNFDLFSSKKYTEIYKKHIGSFVLIDGNKLLYEPDPKIKLPNLIAYIFSNVFSYLLYQRGHLVMHASAIEIDGSSYFFSGRSGVGKSTFVNKLLRYGNFLTEDACCFNKEENSFSILPGLNFIKLDNYTKLQNYSKSYDTQVDYRKRKIISLEPNSSIKSNKFKCGFFLKYGKDTKIEKLESGQKLKAFLANMKSSYPNNSFIDEQKLTLQKITDLISNKCFYNVYRDTGKDFDIDSVLKVIQTS